MTKRPLLAVTLAIVFLTTAALAAGSGNGASSKSRTALKRIGTASQQILKKDSTQTATNDALVPQRRTPEVQITNEPVRTLNEEPVERLNENPVAVPSIQSSATAAPINLDWISINHGGAIEVAAGNIKLGVSVAQPVAGFVEGGGLQLGLGFWYGAAGAAPSACECLCHGDPACDSLITILDAVRVVDVAFRSGAPYPDPSPSCPYEDTDVTCDGLTSILDAVRIVDVAFRGGDANALFCDPCAPPALSQATR